MQSAGSSKRLSAALAAELIPDGASISISGAWMLVPDTILGAIEQRFLASGHPCGLSASFLLCPGGTLDQPGIERLAHAGLLRRTTGGSYPNLPNSPLRRLIAEDKIEAYNLPAGLMAAWFREVGAHRPGVLTTTGLQTFADPRIEGGRMNAAANESPLSLVELGGQTYLHFPAAPVNVSLIRATTADEAGNLTMEDEPAALTAFVQATAARASGGIVIAQVKRVVARGSLPPHEVKVPASLVDFIVVEPAPLQAAGIEFDRRLCTSGSFDAPTALPGSEADQWIARRALREIQRGDTVVLGYGISAILPYLALADGTFHDAFYTVEQGSFGGLPLTDFGFGSSAGPLAILDAASQFDTFQGGCFNLALLSFLQVDAAGRVNVHKLDARPALSSGIGGFLDIAANAPRLVLLGSFTAGGLHFSTDGEKLRIEHEGRMKKFVRQLDHISFDPAASRASEVLYITERCTLRWRAGGLELIEVAPGVDVQRDILAQMEFMPAMA